MTVGACRQPLSSASGSPATSSPTCPRGCSAMPPKSSTEGDHPVQRPLVAGARLGRSASNNRRTRSAQGPAKEMSNRRSPTLPLSEERCPSMCTHPPPSQLSHVSCGFDAVVRTAGSGDRWVLEELRPSPKKAVVSWRSVSPVLTIPRVPSGTVEVDGEPSCGHREELVVSWMLVPDELACPRAQNLTVVR